MTDGNYDLSEKTFERIEEYQTMLENLSQLSSRRQNLNDVFVAINTIFLTGIGILLTSTNFGSVYLFGEMVLITVGIMPINIIWRSVIERYKAEVRVHVLYLMSIEEEFRNRRNAGHNQISEGAIPIGYYHFNTAQRQLHRGKSRLESHLATYFIILYPAITLLVFLLTDPVTRGIILLIKPF